MTRDQIPLTPAEQMKRIREAVHATDQTSAEEAQAVLAAYFSRLDALRGRLMEMESKMVLHEQPFVSHAPIVGRLIVGVRRTWNWMSTKWYALPLIQQQTEFNMAVTQTLRELTETVESLARTTRELQMRARDARPEESTRPAQES